MPSIIDYERVFQQMQGQGLRCLYYNSGAFGFEAGVPTESVGWIGTEDSSLRPEALKLAHKVPQPYENELAARVVRACSQLLPGNIWVMPKSHWAYELDFGSKEWMPELLRQVGIDAASLQHRANAAAIEFGQEEMQLLGVIAEGLLRNLLGSDFALGFPGRPVVCTLHHHKQIWWTSTDSALNESLHQLAK
jgi:hypothetical protein